MKRKVLLVVALMLALSVTMAAMAYNAASVESFATLKIANSNEALLAIMPCTDVLGNKDKTIALKQNGANGMHDGIIEFAFGRGQGGAMFGLQPGSYYRWDKLFIVKNNSEETVECRFKLPMQNFGEYISIQGIETVSTHFSQNQGGRGEYGYGAPFTLKPGGFVTFRVDFSIPKDETFYGEGATELGNFNDKYITVEATAK